MSDATALYVHAVIRAGTALPALPTLPQGGAPFALAAGPVAAVVSRVPRAAFTGEDAADPARIAACAAAHHAVAAALPSPVLPLAFGALFSSADALTGWLGARAPSLAAGLDRVDGAAEWTLALAVDDVAAAAAAAPVAAGAPASPGLAFLRGKIAQRQAQADAAARADAATTRARAVLARHASAVYGAAPRWTALVPHAAEAALHAALAALADDLRPSGLVLTLGGPWPPYVSARAITEEAADGRAA